MTEPASAFQVPVTPHPARMPETDDLPALKARLLAAEQHVGTLKAELDAAREGERLLAHELQHRVRNMLAIIRSIYRRSRESSVSSEEFVIHFEGRLNAIARFHAAIIRSGDGSFDLEDVVRDELLAVHGLDGPALVLSGPPIGLRGKVAELMGLAVHELTTNAVKFGALRRGSLTVDWTIVEQPVPATLHFRWCERGGALLAEAPRVRGFGRQLIEDALPYEVGAQTVFEFRPGVMLCEIILPAAVADRHPEVASVRRL